MTSLRRCRCPSGSILEDAARLRSDAPPPHSSPGGVEWFNHEAFEELLGWLTAGAAVELSLVDAWSMSLARNLDLQIGRFDVAIAAPFAGPIVTYRGYLERTDA